MGKKMTGSAVHAVASSWSLRFRASARGGCKNIFVSPLLVLSPFPLGDDSRGANVQEQRPRTGYPRGQL